MLIKVKHIWSLLIFVLVLSIISSSLCFQAMTYSVDAVPTESDSACVPIILYHEVKPTNGHLVVSPGDFENDLKYLSAHHYTTITMADLLEYAYNDKDLPDKPIILSFDDGYLDNYKYVYPLLKKYNMKIVLSLIAKNTDDFTQIPDDNILYSHVTWTQLNEMLQSGLVEVQNHTYNLHSNKGKRIGCMQMKGESNLHYEEALTEDVMKCQNEIKEMTGKNPSTFTYPYGKFSENTDAVLKKLGFKATLSCKYGVNVLRKGDQDALYNLKRVSRLRGKGIEKTLKGGMETLKYQKSTSG